LKYSDGIFLRLLHETNRFPYCDEYEKEPFRTKFIKNLIVIYKLNQRLVSMGRYLALDIGDKRIGIAVSDPFNSMALPLLTHCRKNLAADIAEILKICNEKDIQAIVCGLPLHFDGRESEQTKKAQHFIDKLQEQTAIKIITEDERMTTMSANRILREGGAYGMDRKKAVDKIAAAIILDVFLQRQKNK